MLIVNPPYGLQALLHPALVALTARLGEVGADCALRTLPAGPGAAANR